MKIAIITVNCKRCGKPLAATNRSLYGLDALKVRIGYLCQNCTTEQEKADINMAIGDGILTIQNK